jgi:ATP-dependent DNA ligase
MGPEARRGEGRGRELRSGWGWGCGRAQSPFAEPTAALVGGRWARPGPDDPAPVFVRPEVAVEVTFLGWESGRLRHPAYGGPSRLL